MNATCIRSLTIERTFTWNRVLCASAIRTADCRYALTMSAQDDFPAKLLNEGVDSLAQGKFEIARETFLRILSETTEPEDRLSRLIALYNLGVLASQVGEAEEAERWFITALAAAGEVDFSPVMEAARFALGRAE